MEKVFEERIEKLNLIKEFMDNIKFQCDYLGLKSNIIYKKQSINEFSKFFSIFRMHLLLIVKLDKNNYDILIECKTNDKTKIIKKEEFDLKSNINLVRDKLKKKHV